MNILHKYSTETCKFINFSKLRQKKLDKKDQASNMRLFLKEINYENIFKYCLTIYIYLDMKLL